MALAGWSLLPSSAPLQLSTSVLKECQYSLRHLEDEGFGYGMLRVPGLAGAFFHTEKKTLFAQLYCLVSYFESKSIPFPKFISKKNSTMAPFPSSTLLKPFGSFRVHRTGCLWSIIDGGDLCGVNYSARFFFGIPGAGSEDLGGFGVCHNHLKQP